VARPIERDAGRVDVLGVGVDALTVEDLHAEIGRLVRGRSCGLVLNANARCLNLCYEDSALRAFFNGAEIVFCDGAGVMLAARILGRRIPERITYADWTWRLAPFAAAEGFSLFLLGARPGVAQAAADKLKERHPDLKIVGVHHGYFDHWAGAPESEAVVREINAAAPDILLVGLGMPLQEYWLMENAHRLGLRLRFREAQPGSPPPHQKWFRVASATPPRATPALAPIPPRQSSLRPAGLEAAPRRFLETQDVIEWRREGVLLRRIRVGRLVATAFLLACLSLSLLGEAGAPERYTHRQVPSCGFLGTSRRYCWASGPCGAS
jgi:N-acetylglucosaminyldiphosphoundecaprenol N-acetyl-beta-D-mannosaminyltransferase